jgi:small-conductance mechanosensitive channel
MSYQTEIIGTVIALAVLAFAVQLVKRLVKRFIKRRSIDPNRKKVILNLHYIALYLLFGVGMAFIWGVDLRAFGLFIASVLTVLGIAFFAQWSILSNLTASAILFFNHPMRIGDRIKVIDKDYNWVGEIKDITGFFLYMRTDEGEYISIPTSLVLQKGIELLEKKEKTNMESTRPNAMSELEL